MNELHVNLLPTTIGPPRRVVLQDSAIARSLWISAGESGAGTYFAPPTARAEIVIAIRDGRPSMFVIGPRATSSWKSTRGLSATATLHLHAGVLPAAGDLRDAAIPAGELFDAGTVARTLQIAAESSVADAALTFARSVRLKAHRHARLAEAAFALARFGPNEIAHRLGVSTRTLRRLTVGELGVTPRELSRFARGARLLELLRGGGAGGRRKALAEIALECGYSDQAHMSNDARSLFGRAPSTLARDVATAIVA